MSSRYEDRLYAELMEEHGHNLTPKPELRVAIPWTPGVRYEVGDVVAAPIKLKRGLLGWLFKRPVKERLGNFICVRSEDGGHEWETFA